MNMQANQGVTLMELLTVIAIIGILASLAVPSYRDMIEKNRLKEAAESLAADMQFTRTEAIKRSTDLRLTLVAGTWCYGIDDGNTACACGTAGDCAIKAVDGSQFQGITLDSNNSATFSFRRGTANAMGSTLSSTNYKARVMVGDVGRVRICTPALPAGLKGLPGNPGC
ncbi:MAG: GspH/FimT family pseudopilin [Methylobacter sp.]